MPPKPDLYQNQAHNSCKFVVIGSNTSNRHALIHGTTPEAEPQTMLYSLQKKDFIINDQPVCCTLFETTQHDKYWSMHLVYLRTHDMAILTFNRHNRDSFEFIKKWLQYHASNLPSQRIQVVLVSTHQSSQEEQEPEISPQEIEALQSSYKIHRYETIAFDAGQTHHPLLTSLAQTVVAPHQKKRAEQLDMVTGSVASRKEALRTQLMKYITRVESHQKNGKIDFSAGLWFSSLLRSDVSREANYKLALLLVRRLDNPTCNTHGFIDTAFTNLESVRGDIFRRDIKKVYADRGIRSKALNAVIFMAKEFNSTDRDSRTSFII